MSFRFTIHKMRLSAIVLGLAIFATDVVTKIWATEGLLAGGKTVIEGFFRLRYVQNEGIAFGFLHTLNSGWKPVLLNVAAVAALLVVFYYIKSTPPGERKLFLSYGLLLGGVLGNFTDRLQNGFVVDFLELHWQDRFVWPTFNVADAAITCGVAIIILETLFGSGLSDSTQESSEDSPPLAGSNLTAWAPYLLPLAMLTPASLQRPDVNELVAKLQDKYSKVRTLSADFRQILTDRGISQEESGTLLMKKPGKMYWEYRSPSRKYFVADGRKSWLYMVDQKQVFETDLDLATADTPLLFLLGRGTIREEFNVTYQPDREGKDGSNLVLKLVPLRFHPEYRYLLLEVEPESALIRRLSVIEPIGNRNDYLLSNVRENIAIPDSKFKPRIPKGVEWIRQ